MSDYHLAEVKRVDGLAGSTTSPARIYTACCDVCGWHGPDRDTKDAAEDDCLAHDVTHNP